MRLRERREDRRRMRSQERGCSMGIEEREKVEED